MSSNHPLFCRYHSMLYLFLLMFGLMFVAPIHESFSQLRIAKTSEVLITLYLPSLWSSGGVVRFVCEWSGWFKCEIWICILLRIHIYIICVYVDNTCIYMICKHAIFWYTNEYVRNIKHMLQPLALTTKKSISGLFEVCPKKSPKQRSFLS